MKNILKVRDLEKIYPGFKLGPINISIPEGAVVGFIGENGAGKSTTIKCILGLTNADGGDVKIFGQKMEENSKDILSRIGVVLDDLNLPGELTIAQTGRFCAKLYPYWNPTEFQLHLEKFKLVKTKKVKELSRGMRMKLSLAIALSHGAKLLLLDEATSGLDPVVREEILDLLLEFIQDETRSVLISSHILSDLEKAADYIAFIHEGKLIFLENKDLLREEYAIYTPDGDESSLSSDAIVGKRSHAYGSSYLVRRSLVPQSLTLDRPSIEEIMLFFIKGGSHVGTAL